MVLLFVPRPISGSADVRGGWDWIVFADGRFVPLSFSLVVVVLGFLGVGWVVLGRGGLLWVLLGVRCLSWRPWVDGRVPIIRRR